MRRYAKKWYTAADLDSSSSKNKFFESLTLFEPLELMILILPFLLVSSDTSVNPD